MRRTYIIGLIVLESVPSSIHMHELAVYIELEIQAIYAYRITWCQINHPWADIVPNENLSHFTLCNMNRPILKTVCIM